MLAQNVPAPGAPAMIDDSAPEPVAPVMNRDIPTPEAARGAAVTKWQEKVLAARDHWEKEAFTEIRKNMRLARGDQWSDAATRGNTQALVPDMLNDDPGSRYVANITLRHIHARTASIYGKNPKFVARRNRRMNNTVWDGNFQTLQQALQTLSVAISMPGDPNAQAAAVEAGAILQDAQQSMAQNKQLDKIAETLERLFEHEIAEQPVPFKVQMKGTVRRALTTGVGYVKIGYQRVKGLRPEIETEMNDMSQQLATLERLAADVADGEVFSGSAEMDQLKTMIESMAGADENQIVLREGLSFSYPNTTSIIPDTAVQQLRHFVGAEWVAEEYVLTRDRIKEVYKVDVGASATSRAYMDTSGRFIRGDGGSSTVGSLPEDAKFCVWEIYDRTTGMVYVVCDGYPDYLVEPSRPDVKLERFFPWFAFVTNEVYDEHTIFPPSDVSLLRDMQLEINRARQGLREHRRAARPKTVARKGVLETADKDNITNSKAHAIIELMGLPENMRVEDALMAFPGPQIDPNLYDTNAAYEDMLRVVGVQEANLGGTSGATATESSIAEGSRMSSVSSIIDDLDEFLTELARASGQVLMAEMPPERVKEIVGPGAVWPELSREQIAREIYLDVEAASTGRPNKQQEIQNATQMMPLLLQIPGLSPEWLAREMLRRLDDRVDITDAFAAGIPSIQALNGMTQPPSGEPGSDPNQQGAEGANNAPSTQPPQQNVAPRTPEPVQQAA
jgi:hypothetical protein